jgi:SAM-dependent methyltransferase
MARRLIYHRDRVARNRRRRRDIAHVRRSMTTDLDLFQAGDLPPGYGIGMSERAVEFGWAVSHGASGRMLDAGSTFNHEHTLDALLPRTTSLDIFTLVPERKSFPERGVRYAYGDLRSLPYPDGGFDCVASLSVLEHVGMDNTGYGASGELSKAPNEAVSQAVAEMRRVLAPGGHLLLTVPYGHAHDHGWFRVFGAGDVSALASSTEDKNVTVNVYAVGPGGWRVSSLEESSNASYGEGHATAVACIHATKLPQSTDPPR